MVLPGLGAPEAQPEEVASRTLQTLRRSVPAAVPGIVFLSGGQDGHQATARLNAMNATDEALPWAMSFSFARALQDEAMKLWKGQPSQVEAAQAAFLHRERLNSAARAGRYIIEMEAGA